MSRTAQAYQWASELTTMGLEAALPAGAGFWADQRWGTGPWLAVLGALLGMAVAGRHLRDFLQRLDRDSRQERDERVARGGSDGTEGGRGTISTGDGQDAKDET